MKKSTSEIRTANWQYDSMNLAAGMDNKDHPSYKALSKYSGNQHTGHSNDGRLVNKGRGPTVGNKGCDVEGPKKPPVSAVPALPKQGSVRDSINRGSQVRTPGGTRTWDPKAANNYNGNDDKINAGRGPTKGNSQ
jgi:hypothetical protein